MDREDPTHLERETPEFRETLTEWGEQLRAVREFPAQIVAVVILTGQKWVE